MAIDVRVQCTTVGLSPILYCRPKVTTIGELI